MKLYFRWFQELSQIVNRLNDLNKKPFESKNRLYVNSITQLLCSEIVSDGEMRAVAASCRSARENELNGN